MLKYILTLLVFVVAVAAVYVRLAPFDANRFHKPVFPAEAGDYEAMNSFTAIRAITTPVEDIVKTLDTVILETPRTQRMVGLPGMDVITYETRSRVFGFPDYTTVSIIEPGAVGNDGPLLAIRGRARFGASDVGVNKARVLGWLERLGPLTVAP